MKGYVVDFEEQENCLVISLTDEGRKWLDGSEDFYEAIEDYLCNGWEIIRPEEIGALTDAPIISYDAIRDDYGELEHIEVVYAYMDYQLYNPVEQLLLHGSIRLEKAEVEEKEQAS